MFVSRFWYFLLSAAVGLLIAVMYLLQDSMNDGLRKNVDDLVQADFVQVQSSLKLQARAHLDRLSEITASEPLREALLPLAEQSVLEPPHPTTNAPATPGGTSPTANPAPPTEEQIRRMTGTLRGILGDLLKARFQDIRRPFLLALNRYGEVVAHEGSFPPPEAQGTEFGLYGFPSVRAVLRGYERDDIWLVRIKGKTFLYQVAGRPVVHQGKYLGAVLLGRPIDDEFAQAIREEAGLNAQLFFFAGDTVVAKSVRPSEPATKDAGPTAPTPEVEPRLIVETVAREAKDWLAYARQPTRPVVNVGDGFRGMFAPLRGEAARAGAGYLVLRPVVAVASPWTVLREASQQSLAHVPAVSITAICLGAFLLAMLWVYLERDRPLAFFRKQALALKDKDNERFNAYLFRGKYRQIAVDINAAIDRTVKAVTASIKTAGPDVAQILGPAGSLKLGSQPIAGFDDEDAAAKAAEPQPAPSQVDLGILGDPGTAPLAPPAPPPPPLAPTPPLVAARTAATPPVPPPPPPPAAPPSPAALMRQLSPAGRVPPPPPRLPLPSMSEPQAVSEADLQEPLEGEGSEGPTRVVSVDDELIAAAQGKVDPSAQREAALQRLFNDFRSTKVQCGESVEGLTYEKFKASVDKSRAAILAKQKCKDVQFSVYVKAGKAALKATPIV